MHGMFRKRHTPLTSISMNGEDSNPKTCAIDCANEVVCWSVVLYVWSKINVGYMDGDVPLIGWMFWSMRG
jgi:hypothetical protein